MLQQWKSRWGGIVPESLCARPCHAPSRLLRGVAWFYRSSAITLADLSRSCTPDPYTSQGGALNTAACKTNMLSATAVAGAGVWTGGVRISSARNSALP